MSKFIGYADDNPDIQVYQISEEPEEWRIYFNIARISYDAEYHGYNDLAEAVANSSRGRFRVDLTRLELGIITVLENPTFRGKKDFTGYRAMTAVTAHLQENTGPATVARRLKENRGVAI